MREEKASALPLLLDVRRMDENNRAYAYRMLRKNIMTLQLQPGCQLSEAELCEQLAMSRTPVHEALMMLKSEWLVDVLPQRGSIVSKISVPYLNEGFAMRRILEPALLRGLAGKLTREQLNEFQELLNRQNEDLYLDRDAADDFFISLDNDFHRLLPAEKNDRDRHYAQFGTDADGGSCDQDQKRKSIENVSERKSRTDRKHRVVIE